MRWVIGFNMVWLVVMSIVSLYNVSNRLHGTFLGCLYAMFYVTLFALAALGLMWLVAGNSI